MHLLEHSEPCRKLPSPPPTEEFLMQKQTKSKQIDLNVKFDNIQQFNQQCVQANNIVYETGKANIDGERIPVKTGWNLPYLEQQLCNYHDKEIVQLLKYGFPIEFDNNQEYDDTIHPNHKGATNYPDYIDAYIQKELNKGTLIGPFEHNPFGKRAKFSPMNTRDKRESTDKRIIMDLSFPNGKSVNNGINKDKYRNKSVSLTLPNIFDLVDKVMCIGRKAKMFKRDLTGAFKQIPVCIGEIHLLGFVHRHKYYFDITLPQGLSNSCYICQRVTDMLMYIYSLQGFEGINYLDDLGGAETALRAEEAYTALGRVISSAGALEAPHKATPPTPRMVFLGTLVDAEKQRIEVMPERLLELQLELQHWLTVELVTIKQVQSLVGKLSFCSVAIRLGRIFFSHMLNFLRENFGNKSFLPVTQEFRDDVKWWSINIAQFNGVSMIPPPVWIGPNILFSTDASLTGMGGWSDGQFFSTPIPVYFTHHLKLHINQLEAIAVMIGFKLWAYKACTKRFLIQCDNMATVTILNTGRTQDQLMQKILREICYICALNDCQFRAVHIPTNQNRISDSLSRFYVNKYFKVKFYKLTRGWTKHQIKIDVGHFQFTNPW